MFGCVIRAFHRRPFLLFILPAIVFVLSFTLYPALYGVYLSLTNLHFGYGTSSFIGFENYIRLFNWAPLPTIISNTFIFVGSVVFLQISIGLAIALLLNERLFGRRFFRGVAILPGSFRQLSSGCFSNRCSAAAGWESSTHWSPLSGLTVASGFRIRPRQ